MFVGKRANNSALVFSPATFIAVASGSNDFNFLAVGLALGLVCTVMAMAPDCATIESMAAFMAVDCLAVDCLAVVMIKALCKVIK